MMFTKDERLDRLTTAIEAQSKDLADIRGQLKAAKSTLSLADEYAASKKKLTDLEIELDRVKESHARETREIEHMVGLEKKRQTFEIDSAKRDAILTVREENLTADRDRFESQMAFMQKRMEGELERLNGLTSEILERLPKVDWHLKETLGFAGNGHRNGDDD